MHACNIFWPYLPPTHPFSFFLIHTPYSLKSLLYALISSYLFYFFLTHWMKLVLPIYMSVWSPQLESMANQPRGHSLKESWLSLFHHLSAINSTSVSPGLTWCRACVGNDKFCRFTSEFGGVIISKTYFYLWSSTIPSSYYISIPSFTMLPELQGWWQGCVVDIPFMADYSINTLCTLTCWDFLQEYYFQVYSMEKEQTECDVLNTCANLSKCTFN